VKEKRKLINDKIRASRVQLILEDWENLWEMSINDARIRAKEKKLDLMEMSRKWPLSIVKMLDFWKYLYKQKKNEKKQKSSGKTPDMKTIRITYKISEHDLDVKFRQVEKFAKIGHPLKVTLMLRWRENHYANLAHDKMKAFIEKLSELYTLEWTINKSGSNFSALLKVIK